jgi:hypothetical protein
VEFSAMLKALGGTVTYLKRYAVQAMQMAQAKYIGQNWRFFGQMVAIFEKGLHSLDDLATRKTGVRGPILPQRPTSAPGPPRMRQSGMRSTTSGRHLVGESIDTDLDAPPRLSESRRARLSPA